MSLQELLIQIAVIVLTAASWYKIGYEAGIRARR